MSKIHEGMLSEQLCDYFYGILADRMSGYRKKHSCQTLLLNMVEQWKQAMDKGEYVGAVLIDLSKAFDCLPHGLLIAKLKAYGLHPSAYRLLASYLHGRRQRVKVGNTRSEWALITKGTPQGSMMGNILFNVFLHDIFYVVDNRVPTRSLFPGKVFTFDNGSLGPGKVLSFSSFPKRSWKSPYFLLKRRLMNRCLMANIW